MKKKGFTLIELLAVIIILAIIALIATPIVMNIIERSRKGAAERSAENYLSAVETEVMSLRANGTILSDGTYTINEDGDVCLNSGCTEKITIEMSGTKPSSGTVAISNGKVVASGANNATTTLTIGEYTATIDSNGNVVATKGSGSSSSGTITVTAATAETKTTGNVPAGNYEGGDEYIIHIGGEDRIFFVLGENESDSTKVDLIMNKNIGDKVVWISDEDWTAAGGDCQQDYCASIEYGPITANAYLASQTTDWEVTPYLPTKEQLEHSYTGSIPLWLYDYLTGATHSVSSTMGYWTASTENGNYTGAWRLILMDMAPYGINVNYNSGPVYATSFGIRPVITLSKSQLG